MSWSQPRSRAVALALRDLLPAIVPGAEPWVSSEDIDKGARWNAELAKQLEESQFGVICFVPENLRSDWVIFEAGAIARSFEKARVAPLLAGVEVGDVPGPLRQFQCTTFGKDDVRKLARSIGHAVGDHVDLAAVEAAFERVWPELERRVQEAMAAPPPERPEAAAVPVTTPPKPELPGPQVRILSWLAQGAGPSTVAVIASIVGENTTRTQYHLDRLTAVGFVNYSFVRGERAYLLTEPGRAYAVENDLDR